MKKSNQGVVAILGLVIVNVVLWLLSAKNVTGSEHFIRQLIAEMLASSALILWACSFVLIVRIKRLEPLFGGLDKMYQIHVACSMIGFLMIILHRVLIPENPVFSPAKPLGIIALLGFVALIVLTFLANKIKMPYHGWKNSHRLLGVFYLVGMIHYAQADALIHHYPVVKGFVIVITLTGLMAWISKIFLYSFIKRQYEFSVKKVRHMQNITEFTLQPADGNFSFNPGQFLFINFPKSVALREAHPFTISSAPQDAQLRLSVKADGDFTERLAQELSEGTLAKVDGPYGMFDYTRYGSRQIWIAGGIGITPFLSWLKSMGPAASQEIEIFYCARNEEDAIYAEEIRTLCEALPKVACHLHLSEGSGRITAKKIEEQIGDVKGRDICLCAPGAMRTTLVKQFQELGVSSDSIHFEAFNLR